MAKYFDRDTKVAYVEQINNGKMTVNEIEFLKRAAAYFAGNREKRYVMIKQEHKNLVSIKRRNFKP